MEAEELIKIIKEKLDKELIDFEITPLMYDPIKMQYKVSLGIMEKCLPGLVKRFTITVDDHKPRKYN